MSWLRVTRRKPCPICQKPDWCSIADRGDLIICMRVESAHKCKNGGWYHGEDAAKLFGPDARDLAGQRRARPVEHKPENRPVVDFTDLACQYEKDLTNINVLATELGVSARSLERLQVGWSGKGYSFPMRDGRERIIGIRIRGKGRKWCVPGSHNGLFWPQAVYSGSESRLVICEGPTDCAALLDLGYDAIGRPSCSGGVDQVVEVLKGRRREVVIMADHDEAKQRPDGSTWYPGQEGAAALAKAIRPFVKTLKVVKPPFHKDVRDWYRAGATRDVVEAVIQNTRYVT